MPSSSRNADTIVSVGTGASAVPRGARVIDLRRYTGIPGMIDAHTHITYYWDGAAGTDPWQQSGRRRSQVTVFLAQENARKTLESGVTTIRDLGASDYSDLAMRDLINRGAMVGPRVFAAGYGLRRAPATTQPNAPPGPPRGRLTGVEDVAAAVKAQVDAGADVIKVYGSTGSGADVTGRETLTYDEMKAIVDAAHAAGKRVAIHSYGPDGGRDAVRAGAESLEHAIDLDDSTLVRMVAQGTFYVPTIDHNRYYAEYHQQFNYTPAQVAALDSFRLRNIETARRAFKAGVQVRDGLGRGVQHVRAEHAGAGLVYRDRDDAGTGARDRNDEWCRAAGHGKEARRRGTRLLRGPRCRGRRSARRYSCRDRQGPVGHEGRAGRRGPTIVTFAARYRGAAYECPSRGPRSCTHQPRRSDCAASSVSLRSRSPCA